MPCQVQVYKMWDCDFSVSKAITLLLPDINSKVETKPKIIYNILLSDGSSCSSDEDSSFDETNSF